MSKDFTKDELKDISTNGNVHDFSADHSSIKKEVIHQYLMVKNNIKCLILFKKKNLLDYQLE